MEPFSLIIMIFVILTWVTVVKISKEMKKEFEELKQDLKNNNS
jgi:hypothetical protein